MLQDFIRFSDIGRQKLREDGVDTRLAQALQETPVPDAVASLPTSGSAQSSVHHKARLKLEAVNRGQ